ncbi:MAG: hypothetical protein JXA77_12870 [Bacteroidales bacterium]|nr:hypothetical protein [Bacteroidales bacterium]
MSLTRNILIFLLLAVCLNSFSQETILEQKSNFRQKTSVGFFVFSRLSKINSPTLNSLNITDDSYKWNVANKKFVSPEINLWYNISSHIQLKTGLSYIKQGSTISLNELFSAPYSQTDINGDEYIEYIKADYHSSLSFSCINLPVSLSYLYHFNYKFSLFIEAGITTSWYLKSEYQLKGNYSNYGYYASHPNDIQIINSGELGFGETLYDPPITKPLSTKKIVFSGNLGLGVLVQTNNNNSFRFEPKINLGLNSITDTEDYLNIFGTIHDTKPTRINAFGFEISYIRKL